MVISKKIYIDHYDIEGNPIDVVTCSKCGHQERKKDEIGLWMYDRDMKCCENPSYFYGISIPENNLSEDKRNV